MARPVIGSYGRFYQGYVDAASGSSVAQLISDHAAGIHDFMVSLPEEKADFAYAEEKWTIKQLLQHLIDTERVFSYRALRISRNDPTPMPGFDENAFAANAPVHQRNLEELKKEFICLRASTDLMMASFTPDQLNLSGNVNGHSMNLNALCFIIYGHNLHHIQVMKERYLHG